MAVIQPGIQDTNLSAPASLEQIDKLHDLNIGRHVPLPQIVVVGDQSSGKSSLLYSLTGTPFRQGQGLCTRHVTQITSRRGKAERVEIRIIPGPHATEEHRKEVKAFRVDLPSNAEFRENFLDIMNQAGEAMGLRSETSYGQGEVFSEDILKIQVHGPKEDNLTIIDVPGIFRTTTNGTTKNDMAIIRDQVKEYIKDERTIILAVLPSNIDMATQEILELAEEYDRYGERTIGVLTKPDLVNEPNAQAAVCDLIQGKHRPLTLGYYLVRNRGADDGLEELTELEKIFQLHPWNMLPQERVGVLALKDQLSSLLADITERELPGLRQDITAEINQCKKELDELGPSRQDTREQRTFLTRVAENFQDRVRAALAADYNADSSFDQNDGLRLMTLVVNITDVFGDDFRKSGHSRHFQNSHPAADLTLDDHTPSSDSQAGTPVGLSVASLREILEVMSLDDPTPSERAELGDILFPEHRISEPRDGIHEWINSVYLRSRGLDLGTFNSNMVAMAFVEQSRKWGDMTKLYMSRIVVTLHRFIATALSSVGLDDKSRAQLWSSIVDRLLKSYHLAMAQANLLIEVEQRKLPYTLNQQFAKAHSVSRGQRLTELLRPKARKDTRQYGEKQYMVNLDDIAQVVEGKGNAEQLQEEIHDILRAYYNLALDRFIDNVFQLAVDYSLLRGPDSPLKAFTPEWVITLEPEDLERIIGEAKTARKRRSKIMKKIEDLTKAYKILQ